MGYTIGSKLLAKYNVSPLEYYIMQKTDENEVLSSITIKGNYIYGYFKEDGSLYKIYQPKVKDSKFIKVRDYIQGSEQLTYDKPFLVITSSLKDLMAYNKLKISNSEAIAPDSENTMIGESTISLLSKRYNSIIVLFDNDEPGVKAAEKYKSKYGFNYVILDLEKDLSDAIKVHGVDKVRDNMLPLLKQTL
jgi:5S rRNA maturation endonuclease (ribonuclease M5)